MQKLSFPPALSGCPRFEHLFHWACSTLAVIVLGVAVCAVMSACATPPPSAEKNLTQSGDTDIVHEVIDRLRNDAITGKFAFGVTSEDGVVTLRGAVSDQNVRLRAVGIVRSTPGVKGVIDKLFRSQSSVGVSFSP